MLQELPGPAELRAVAADIADITELTLRNSGVYDRFADTSPLSRDDAHALGCLGYVARASGIATDARLDHPATPLPVREAAATAGDVLARYTVRRRRIRRIGRVGLRSDRQPQWTNICRDTATGSERSPQRSRHRRRLAWNHRAPRRDQRRGAITRSRSWTHPGSTGPPCRSPWPTPSFRSSR